MHYDPQPVEPLPLHPGDRVTFANEPNRPYTVRAATDNFAVVTRQADFHKKGVLRYAVIDWRNGVRGPINVVGQGWDVDTDEQCLELCELCEAGTWEVSQRNWVRLNITRHSLRTD